MLYINDMSCVKFHLYGMKTILDIAQIYNNYEVFEILTQKYNSTGELTKKNPHQHQKMSMIRSLVDSSIYEGDYDFLEICLKYVIDIHELNDRGESYLETAMEYSDPNGIMVEAIKIILQKMIDKLFSELCNNEKKVKKYVKNWISHLLQNPGDKPGVSLIYLSILGGIGKNLFWQEFLGRKILGENLYNHALNLGEMTNRFNTGMAYKLLTVCDEVVKPKNEEMNYIKALITSNQFNYEEKGQKRISIGDYNRYVFITNNINSMRIERGDRRFVCIESSASLKNNNEFFIKFRKDVLGNARILRYYYEYMLNRDISDFDVRKIPNTIYKEELEEMNRSVYMKSLESNYKNYAGKFVSYVDLYKDVESYCLDHGDRTYKDKLLMVKEYASYDKLMKKDRQGKSSDRGFRFESLEILDEYFNR